MAKYIITYHAMAGRTTTKHSIIAPNMAYSIEATMPQHLRTSRDIRCHTIAYHHIPYTRNP
eukprot:9490259-Pyramimonas_sp.AAC.1